MSNHDAGAVIWVVTMAAAAAAWWDGRNPFAWGLAAFFASVAGLSALMAWVDGAERKAKKGDQK